MGLDWVLHKDKPKEGSEERFEELEKALRSEGLSDKKRKKLEKELEEVSISAYSVLGCPRIGIDEAATNWFRSKLYPSNKEYAEKGAPTDAFVKYWSRPVEEVLKDEIGKWVPELAGSKEGIASITGMLTSPLDFRGKVIGYCDFVDSALQEEAYSDHTGEEAEDYGKRLEGCLQIQTKKMSSKTKKEFHAEIEYVKSAIKWLKFWGGQGFGFYAWY